jgi:hypothetical protein
MLNICVQIDKVHPQVSTFQEAVSIDEIWKVLLFPLHHCHKYNVKSGSKKEIFFWVFYVSMLLMDVYGYQSIIIVARPRYLCVIELNKLLE